MDDRISDLPDELLLGILDQLRSLPAAARTSVLSRRWRRVWASVPDIVIVSGPTQRAASFVDMVDAALAASFVEIGRFVFADAVGHLRRLDVEYCSAMAPLMRQFDMVDELRLNAPFVSMHIRIIYHHTFD
jgi:hypothetical protein